MLSERDPRDKLIPPVKNSVKTKAPEGPSVGGGVKSNEEGGKQGN